MKTKQVRVRIKDVTTGRKVFVASRFGIEEITFLSRPYPVNMMGGSTELFARIKTEDGESKRALSDMGIYRQYNYKRTFRKLKHARKWAKWLESSTGFQRYRNELKLSWMGLSPDFFDQDNERTAGYKEWRHIDFSVGKSRVKTDTVPRSMWPNEFGPSSPFFDPELVKRTMPAMPEPMAEHAHAMMAERSRKLMEQYMEQQLESSLFHTTSRHKTIDPELQNIPFRPGVPVTPSAGCKSNFFLHAYQRAVIDDLRNRSITIDSIPPGAGKY